MHWSMGIVLESCTPMIDLKLYSVINSADDRLARTAAEDQQTERVVQYLTAENIAQETLCFANT